MGDDAHLFATFKLQVAGEHLLQVPAVNPLLEVLLHWSSR